MNVKAIERNNMVFNDVLPAFSTNFQPHGPHGGARAPLGLSEPYGNKIWSMRSIMKLKKSS